MKSIFDKTVREEFIDRVASLNESSKAVWGKMNIYQMIRHCTLWEEMVQGKRHYKRMFLGRLFGKMALRKVLGNNAPLRRSNPTLPELVIKDAGGNIEIQKAEWIAAIRNYENFSNPDFVHVFFGKMTKEQIGYLVYKHIDHHLRQFAA